MTDDAGRAASLRDFLRATVRNWTGPGWDAARQGFHERLTAELTPAPGFAHRRLHLCARQLYVLARAPAVVGAEVPAGLTQAVFETLVRRFRDPVHGGFFARLDLDGAPLDRRKDLYGLAFVLFGLAAYRAATGDDTARDVARQTLQEIQQHMAVAGGWFAAITDEDWAGGEPALVQNPHMHLFEACLAQEHVDADPRWREAADALRRLFDRHLYDKALKMLGEFFDDSGNPPPDHDYVVEPGHQFEWAWLLFAHAARRGTAPPAAAGDLIDTAVAFGTDPEHGGIWDRMNAAGEILDENKRIWPVCEAIKAHAARWRAFGQEADRTALRSWLDFLQRHYLLRDGRWHEHLTRERQPFPGVGMPGTTPYHLLMMAEEALPVLEGSAQQS
jgi:mannose/cellobiose epimerase-like protein (N-acyl-D-glucosamine 2-epimerase family)